MRRAQLVAYYLLLTTYYLQHEAGAAGGAAHVAHVAEDEREVSEEHGLVAPVALAEGAEQREGRLAHGLDRLGRQLGLG